MGEVYRPDTAVHGLDFPKPVRREISRRKFELPSLDTFQTLAASNAVCSYRDSLFVHRHFPVKRTLRSRLGAQSRCNSGSLIGPTGGSSLIPNRTSDASQIPG